jgi:O-antigen/teichoic acid export membrane protein
MMNLYNSRLSLDYSGKKYIKLSALNSIVSLCLSLVLMYTVLNNNRILGRLLGLTIAVSFVSGISIYSLFKKARPKYNKRFLTFGLKYSAPLIAHGVAQTLLAQFDRIMIKYIVGLAEAGIYSFGGSIKNLLNVVANSLNMVWATWFFYEMAKNNITKVKRRASEYTLLVLLFGVSALFIAPEVVKLLGAKEYWDARFLAPPMVLDSYVMFIYAIVVQAEYYTKKTHYVLIGTVIAAIINIITNTIFINLYGYVAAAYTTLFAYSCYLVFHIIIAYKAIGFHVVKISQHLLQGLVVGLCATLCLAFMDKMVFRWILMIIFDGIIGYVLIRMIVIDGDINLRVLLNNVLRRNKE